MRVGEPEVERHHRRLDEQRADDHAERRLDDGIVRARRDVLGERGKIERARARIDEPDAGQHHEAAERVGDREIERPADRRALELIGCEREGCDAHHLEPDEQVEEVVRQREADHRRHEQQHQHLEVRRDFLEIAPRENEAGGEEEADQGGDARRGTVGGKCNAERDAVPRHPAAEPDRDGKVSCTHGQRGTGEAGEQRGECGDDIGARASARRGRTSAGSPRRPSDRRRAVAGGRDRGPSPQPIE